MCFECHGDTEANNLNRLKNIKKEDYAKFNSTSISHILIHLSGADGENVHDIAAHVISDYLKWYIGWSYGLWQFFKNPHDSMFSMPYTFELEKWIIETEQFYKEHKHLHKEEILNEYKKFTINYKLE